MRRIRDQRSRRAGARAAVEKAGKTAQVGIIGFDGQPEAREAIRAEKIYADPIQFPDRIGVEIVTAIARRDAAAEDAHPYDALSPGRCRAGFDVAL